MYFNYFNNLIFVLYENVYFFKIDDHLISFINSYSLRILKSILFFGVLLFANSHLHAQTKIDLTKNVTDTAGKKKDSTAIKKDTTN